MSNAFINSDLPENRLVLIDPPSLLISLGYLPQGTVWVAKRAIYGLRESPALWAATRNKEMAKLTLGNGLILRPSKTHAALWLLYHAVDEGVRPGQVDENGELVTPEGVVPLQNLCQATWHDRSIRRRYLRSRASQGLSEKPRKKSGCFGKLRLLRRFRSKENWLFWALGLAKNFWERSMGFNIHQLPFAEQLVKRVSADGAMRRRDTPCEPESYAGRTPETPRREFSEREKAAEMHRLQSLVGSLIWLVMPNSPRFGIWSQHGGLSDNQEI